MEDSVLEITSKIHPVFPRESLFREQLKQGRHFCVYGFILLASPVGIFRKTTMVGTFDTSEERKFYFNSNISEGYTWEEIGKSMIPICFLKRRFFLSREDSLVVSDDGSVWLGPDMLSGKVSQLYELGFNQWISGPEGWTLSAYWERRLSRKNKEKAQ